MTIPVLPNSLDLSFGFYGKIPALGDFVSRNIVPAQREHIDAWFQAGLAYFQTVNAHWLDDYLVAPVWCFIMPAGCWGERAVCGALMPSVDRVGRYYPFLTLSEPESVQLEAPEFLYQRLAAVARRLPTLLYNRLLPDEITVLLQSDASARSAPDDSVLSLQLDRLFSSARSSYWWVPDQQNLPFLTHDTVPNETLFSRLFSDDLNFLQ